MQRYEASSECGDDKKQFSDLEENRVVSKSPDPFEDPGLKSELAGEELLLKTLEYFKENTTKMRRGAISYADKLNSHRKNLSLDFKQNLIN